VAKTGRTVVQDPISTSIKMSVVVCACHPSYTGNINRRIAVLWLISETTFEK
jgi:hypothetical protein